MPYELEFHHPAIEQISELRAFDQRRVMTALEQQLIHEPALPTRRRKLLQSVVPGFEHVLPVWELRVDEFRVFYDVEELRQIVHVRAVKRKEPRQRTGDIV